MVSRKKYRYLLSAAIMLLLCLMWKNTAQAGMEKEEYVEEIEKQGFRTSTAGMSKSDVKEYLRAMERVYYDGYDGKKGNPFAVIKDELACLYMGDEYLDEIALTDKKGNAYIGTVKAETRGQKAFPYTEGGGRTLFQFILKENFDIEILADTVASDEPDYMVTVPGQITYGAGGYTVREYHSAWTDKESGMRLEITFPFLEEEGEERFNKWEKTNRALRDAVAPYFLDMEKVEGEKLQFDYTIKTLDEDLYSVLYTAAYEETLYRFGTTVALKIGETVPVSVLSDKTWENGAAPKDYGYYTRDGILYILSENGAPSQAEKLRYQPHYMELYEKELYDDTDVMTGTISFRHPVLEEDSAGAKEINRRIMEDMELFYEKVTEDVETKALKNAEDMRGLYHQEGQEGYEHEMRTWYSGGGLTGLFVECDVTRNNHGEFALTYRIYDRNIIRPDSSDGFYAFYQEAEKIYTCTYNTDTGEMTEKKDYLGQIVEDIKEMCADDRR